MAKREANKDGNGKKITKLEIVKPKVDILKSASGIVTIPGVRTERFVTLIIGTSPLVCHKFAEKAQAQILAKHKGEASAGRERKDPVANYMAARYRLSDGSDGVHAGGVKAALVKGFSKESGVPMTKAKGAIRVAADDEKNNYVRIIGPRDARAATSVGEPNTWPGCREDIVRNENGVVDIRHRPEYWPWAMRLEIAHMPAVCSTAQTLQAVSMSGFVEGLCEWRPGSKTSLSGTLGTWRLATAEEVALFEAGKLFDDVSAVGRQQKNGNSRRRKAA
jgi:hypothetical protein